MNYKKLLVNDLVTDNTQEKDKIFLKTSQNVKYATSIKDYITPFEILNQIKTPKFIGITGTNGKTTTAFVLGFLLKSLGFNVAIQGTEGFFYNLEKVEKKTLTTPPILDTLKRVAKYESDFFIMEVSSHAIVQNRIESIKFSAKVLTSFSQDHLDFHKSMDEYKKTKESFFQDESLKIVKGKKKGFFIDVDGYLFKMNEKNLYLIEKPLIEEISMAGEFNKFNFSLALKCAEVLTGRDLEELKEILKEFKGVGGRMEVLSKNPLIVVDFAHTPDGMEKVLSSLDGRKIVVFGAGGNRDKKKRPLMGEIASKYADYIILTEDNPRCENGYEICKDIAKGVKKPYEIILDRKKAIKKAIELASDNDIVLVLGKGDETYIEYCDKRVQYSDKETIKSLLKL